MSFPFPGPLLTIQTYHLSRKLQGPLFFSKTTSSNNFPSFHSTLDGIWGISHQSILSHPHEETKICHVCLCCSQSRLPFQPLPSQPPLSASKQLSTIKNQAQFPPNTLYSWLWNGISRKRSTHFPPPLSKNGYFRLLRFIGHFPFPPDNGS